MLMVINIYEEQPGWTVAYLILFAWNLLIGVGVL